MRAVQITVLIDHLRFKPQAEFHAKRMDLISELTHGAFHFFLIRIPVAKTAVVAVTFTEPAII